MLPTRSEHTTLLGEYKRRSYTEDDKAKLSPSQRVQWHRAIHTAPDNVKSLWQRVSDLPGNRTKLSPTLSKCPAQCAGLFDILVLIPSTGRGANKTELKRVLQDMFFKRGAKWQGAHVNVFVG